MRLETLTSDQQWPPPHHPQFTLSPPADNSAMLSPHFLARRALFTQQLQQLQQVGLFFCCLRRFIS